MSNELQPVEPPEPASKPSDPTTVDPTAVAATVGRAILKAGAWTGRSARAAYLAVDPAMRQHIAETSLFGLTYVAGRRTPDLRLPDDGGRAVVFVHGLAGHRGNLLPMQRYFSYRGRKRAVSIGFDDKGSIEAMADQLAAALHEILEVNALGDGPVIDIVAHSMGGIVSRLALLDEVLAGRVNRLVTIATPHEGTQLARFLDTPKVRSLRPKSELLQRLDGQLPWSTEHPRLVCFWSNQDLILMPPESAFVEGAEAIERSDCTHNGFLLRPRAIREIFEATSR